MSIFHILPSPMEPNAGGTVLGSIGEDDGIACEEGAEVSKCQEAYAKSQGLHLKVPPKPGWTFLGWRVNGKIVSDEELLHLLK